MTGRLFPSNKTSVMKSCLVMVLAAISLIFFSLKSSPAQSTETATNQITPVPSDARFTVIQSEIGPKWTFKLDRLTGVVYQLITLEDENNRWERMRIEGLPKIDNPIRPRFILFTSANGPRWTFLMDTSTGRTWILVAHEVQTSEGETTTRYAWQRIEDN